MTSFLEVVDSAVKIGLGALIAGVATYATTRTKGDIDTRLETLRHKRALFEKLALSIEDAANAISAVLKVLNGIPFAESDDRGRLRSQSRDLYVTVFEKVNATEAIATLVGSDSLRRTLSEYAEVTRALYNLIYELPNVDHDLNPTLNRLHALHMRARDDIRNSYARLAA